MGALIPTLARLSTAEIGSAVARMKRATAFYSFIALMTLTAYVALVAAITLFVARSAGPIGATIIVAIAAICLAGIALVAQSVARVRERRRREQQQAARHAAMMTAAVPLLPLIFRSKALLGLAAVGGAGFLLANRRRGRIDD